LLLTINNSSSYPWTAFYNKNRNDGGAVEALFQQDDDTLSAIAKSHTLDRNKLISTITGSDGANFMLVPAAKKNSLEWIHQGMAFDLTFRGDMLLAFAHGNLSSSPFKLLTITTAIDNLGTTGSTTRKATAGHLSPKPESCFSVKDKTGFATLPAEDCGVLQGHPNHAFIHPSYFIHCYGPKTVRASYLAVAIIDQLQEQREAEPNNADAQAEVANEMTAVAPLLAFLWASAKGYLAHVSLVDPPDNAQLNIRCERIRPRIREAPLPPAPTGNPRPAGAPSGGMTGVDTANLALAAQTLTMAMTTNEMNRVQERDEDKSSKSLISNLGPRQQCLFERLATESMGDPPAMSAFMVNILKEKSPAKLAHLLMAEMRKWKGCCTEASIHRFLAYGFMSENASDLGGLPGIIFAKRSLLSTGSTSAANERQRVMEYFDCDMEPQVIENYLKKECAIPREVH
jgi:hypothetical protein